MHSAENYDYDEAADAPTCIWWYCDICPVMIYEEQGFEEACRRCCGLWKQWHPVLTEA